MNIPSIKKIEAQTKAYALTLPEIQLEPDEQKEYNALYGQYQKLRNQLDKARKNCPGDSQCTCENNPVIQNLTSAARELCHRINTLYLTGRESVNAQRFAYRLSLLRSREAKINFRRDKMWK